MTHTLLTGFKRLLQVTAALLLLSSWNAFAAEMAGQVLAVKGMASATGADGVTRSLKRAATVNVGDVVTTDEGSVQLRMKDGAVIVVGSGAELEIRAYSYQDSGADDEAVLHIAKGMLRTVTGSIDKSNYTMTTPTGTIGIRGTAYGIVIGTDGSVSVVLDGGAVVLSSFTSAEIAVLDVPGLMSIITANQPPSAPAPTTAELNGLLNGLATADAMRSMAGSGTVIEGDGVDMPDIIIPASAPESNYAP